MRRRPRQRCISPLLTLSKCPPVSSIRSCAIPSHHNRRAQELAIKRGRRKKVGWRKRHPLPPSPTKFRTREEDAPRMCLRDEVFPGDSLGIKEEGRFFLMGGPCAWETKEGRKDRNCQSDLDFWRFYNFLYPCGKKLSYKLTTSYVVHSTLQYHIPV